MALYDRIGVGYNTARGADPRIVDDLVEQLGLRPEGRYLDIACGTGNYTHQLAERGGVWAGLDASERMLDVARSRPSEIEFVHADVHDLPFPDESFDGVVCTLATHHFEDRVRAFAEARRVLRGGRLVAFVCEADRTQRFWLRAYFPEMFARIGSREPGEAQMLSELSRAGFAQVETRPYVVPPDVEDAFLYGGKYRPELYFDPAVRAGISSFANFSDPVEVETGLARLREDLDSGLFSEVAAQHPTVGGDYLFLSAAR
jgi:ubiquinone/menaquinone biosynthesis C-methylase UbiE